MPSSRYVRLVAALLAALVMVVAVVLDVQGIAEGSDKIIAAASAVLLILLARSKRAETREGERGGERPAFLAVVAELGVAVLIIREFRIETPAFHDLLIPLAFAGFIIQNLLPRRLRVPFFALLSLAGILLVLGPGQGLFLITIGGLLLSLCHLPFPFRVRLALIVAAGILLAAWRTIPGVPHPLWPLLGSMFMFRLLLYLHDLRYARPRFDLFRSLAYFFMLPNIVFPLFPVVDHEKFRAGCCPREPVAVYERGLRWLLFGVLHLLAYRWVKGSLLASPETIDGAGQLLRYLAANFLLILKVSGQFHLAAGLLLLFGFDLPKVMGNFLVAPSFAEFWRRANIYWHDFMLKVFYLPVFTRLRGKTTVRGRMILATGAVFLVSGALHSYQWFWLRGNFPLRLQDLLFWGLFGVLVAAGQLRQMARPRVSSNMAHGAGAFFLIRAVRILTVMSGVVVLWSIWTASSLSAWASIWRPPGAGFAGWVVPAVLAIAAAFALGLSGFIRRRKNGASKTPRWHRSLASGWRLGPVLLLAFFLFSQPAAYSPLGQSFRRFVGDLKMDRPSVLDRALMLRWYYEGLDDSALYNSELWRFYNGEWPTAWGNQYIMRDRDDFLSWELRPAHGVEFRGAWLTANRWGLRDKEYDRQPRPGVYRIALLGASVDMGAGVADGQTYESLLEERLNREAAGPPRVEILNFAVDGYDPLRRLLLLERKVTAFRPHAVWYAGHPDVDLSLLKDQLLRADAKGQCPPFEFVQHLLGGRRAGVKMQADVLARRIATCRRQLLEEIYAKLAAICRDHSLSAACLVVPEPWGVDPERIQGEIRAARAAGLEVMDLSAAFAGRDPDSLNVAPWDSHPNALGHRLLAEELYRLVMKKGPPR